jgi:hypothetical protein
MDIENWQNKKFKGSLFDSGLYNDTFDIFKLKETNLPYAMASFEIDTNECIIIGMDRDN